MKSILVFTLLLVACGDTPTPTGTTCPDPDPMTLTWENFGEPFMTKYCTWCHDSSLTRSKRNGAPLYHDFNTLLGVLKTPDHIDEQAGFGPDAQNEFMPPDRCPATLGGPRRVPPTGPSTGPYPVTAPTPCSVVPATPPSTWNSPPAASR